MINVHKLKKSYGDHQAVRGISFQVSKGDLFAFLGPNGAGKSTTINIIATLLKHDSGNVTIDGYEVGYEDQHIRQQLGVVFQESLLDPLLSVKENLEVRASFYDVDIQEAVLRVSEQVDILSFLNRPYGKLSGGQKRRVDIARALLHDPKILILDEPTTGLDPQTRQRVWELIETLMEKHDMTVFLTTHYMEEANKADYVVIIDEGIAVASGTPFELKRQYSYDSLILYPNDLTECLKHISEPTFLENGSTIKVKLRNTLSALELLNNVKDYIDGFEVIQGTLDEAFIEITGKEIRG